MYCQRMRSPYRWSPSSRRAWIEICVPSVQTYLPMSPSSRRAWIEIDGGLCPSGHHPVALLAEGVDRNTRTTYADRAQMGRPPRGGRG